MQLLRETEQHCAHTSATLQMNITGTSRFVMLRCFLLPAEKAACSASKEFAVRSGWPSAAPALQSPPSSWKKKPISNWKRIWIHFLLHLSHNLIGIRISFIDQVCVHAQRIKLQLFLCSQCTEQSRQEKMLTWHQHGTQTYIYIYVYVHTHKHAWEHAFYSFRLLVRGFSGCYLVF